MAIISYPDRSEFVTRCGVDRERIVSYRDALFDANKKARRGGPSEDNNDAVDRAFFSLRNFYCDALDKATSQCDNAQEAMRMALDDADAIVHYLYPHRSTINVSHL